MQKLPMRNEADFTEYYNITISITRYYENLLEKLAREMDLNKSQVIRKAIYELYQREIKGNNK